MRMILVSAAAAIALLFAAETAQAQVWVNQGVNPWTGRQYATQTARNPWTGTTVQRTNTFNPWTGTQTTRVNAVNPWTGGVYRGGAAFNPWTGQRAFYGRRW